MAGASLFKTDCEAIKLKLTGQPQWKFMHECIPIRLDILSGEALWPGQDMLDTNGYVYNNQLTGSEDVVWHPVQLYHLGQGCYHQRATTVQNLPSANSNSTKRVARSLPSIQILLKTCITDKPSY